MPKKTDREYHFNPRPPRGGRPGKITGDPYYFTFQSTPPARGATLITRQEQTVLIISIHAPREGGDAGRRHILGLSDHFNPRPPRGGRRHNRDTFARQRVFQSTPPARGATRVQYDRSQGLRISIHAPREGGDRTNRVPALHQEISIHAPREGGDKRIQLDAFIRADFNPRPPRGGRLLERSHQGGARPISIHAPREGGDREALDRLADALRISIHAPREGGDGWNRSTRPSES